MGVPRRLHGPAEVKRVAPVLHPSRRCARAWGPPPLEGAATFPAMRDSLDKNSSRRLHFAPSLSCLGSSTVLPPIHEIAFDTPWCISGCLQWLPPLECAAGMRYHSSCGALYCLEVLSACHLKRDTTCDTPRCKNLFSTVADFYLQHLRCIYAVLCERTCEVCRASRGQIQLLCALFGEWWRRY